MVKITNPDGCYDWYQAGGRFAESVVDDNGKPKPSGQIKDINIFGSHIFGVATPEAWIDKYKRTGYREDADYWQIKENCVWDEQLAEILSNYPPDTPYTFLDCHS